MKKLSVTVLLGQRSMVLFDEKMVFEESMLGDNVSIDMRTQGLVCIEEYEDLY